VNSQDAEPRDQTVVDGATNDELRALVTELEGRWHRTVADFDNFRRRTARDLERLRAVERSRQAAAWLPVLDNLDAALAHAGTDPGAIVDGVLAVRDQAVEMLAGLGFPRRDDEVGTPFDPELHEAVGAVPSVDVEPGTIVEVLRPGYGEGEHLLRPASVVVARAD
jgi:molecular chaperone GrpE